MTTSGRLPADVLARESRLLVERLRLWTPARWAAAAPVLGTRGDVVHHLAQSLADAVAGLEREPRRAVPRLETDLALPDQLAVTAADLVRSHPPDPISVDAAAHLLLHRCHLLDDAVPAGLARDLGLDDLPAQGHAVCCSG